MIDYIWRCSVCGKWSHAVKKPKYHQRGTTDPDEQDTILRAESGGYIPMEGPSEDIYYVACGPFETYEVRKIGAEEHEDSRPDSGTNQDSRRHQDEAI